MNASIKYYKKVVKLLGHRNPRKFVFRQPLKFFKILVTPEKKISKRLTYGYFDGLSKDEKRSLIDQVIVPINSKGHTYFNQPNQYIAKLSDAQQEKRYLERLELARVKKKVVVYTCITGGYDRLLPPEYLDLDVDYICYTDSDCETYGIWELRELPWADYDNTRSARFVKMNPHLLLKDYDYAIWIDSNILLRCPSENLIESVGANPLATFKHPLRDCVYDEAEACIAAGKDEHDVVSQQVKSYENMGFERGAGLYETNVICHNLKSPKHSKLMDTWWKELNQWSKRDQLSLPYVRDKCDVSLPLLVEGQTCARDNDNFAIFPHGHVDIYPIPGFYSKYSNILSPQQTNKNLPQSILSQETSVDVVVCVHNAFDDVVECMDSLLPTIKGETKIIIVDDGSEAQTKEYLEGLSNEFSSIHLIRNDQAKRYTKAANIGVKASEADWVILLNSDTIVTRNWIEKIVQKATFSDKIGIIGPLSNAASYQSIPNIKGKDGQTAINILPEGYSIEDMNSFCEELSVDVDLPFTPLVHGFCMCVSKEVFQTIGYFDEENFPKGFGEENDFCFRAHDAGFKLCIATDTYVFHEKTKSYNPELRKSLQKNSGKRFSEIYGVERVHRSVLTFEHNPVLMGIRARTEELFKSN